MTIFQLWILANYKMGLLHKLVLKNKQGGKSSLETSLRPVIPAKAGTPRSSYALRCAFLVPACAGMTVGINSGGETPKTPQDTGYDYKRKQKN
jgi:hypothetical protein